MKHTPSTPACASSVTYHEAQEMVVRGPKGRQPALEIEAILTTKMASWIAERHRSLPRL